MVNLLGTDLGIFLKRTIKLSEDKVWQKSFDAKLKKQILDWIRNDQLQKGFDEDKDIMGLYSEWTEMINPDKVAGTPYTLKDTGEFYKSLFINVLSDYFEVDGNGLKKDSETGKITDLFKWLGEGIVGLTEENKDKLAEELKIKYIEYVRKVLQID
ncbi:hypothetical protein UFOVP597_55 [uncultured Caudovirales phage]|uniref:Uncharacterized protein n=1 Tax=uncultured Caudovirales phage TaxID=2100421 RepID=A0A6J5N226_9CAUD|nr:hypothetical protein UFOVP597_55 [uncultured Caudovirales phage]